MLAYKLLRVVVHLFVGLAICAFVFPLVGAAARQARIKAWSRRLITICGVRLDVVVAPDAMPTAQALIVANHVSWLDIFVINALQPCRFVAKSDIRGWPLIGWLCARTGTIFIARGKRRDVRRIYQDLVQSLLAGERIAFFPEGTTAGQGALLPFHANLFEAAIDARVPVQPYAVRYLDAHGRLHPAADFTGDTTFAQSLMTILKSGPMLARLTLLRPIDVASTPHRRALAETAHAAIAQALRR